MGHWKRLFSLSKRDREWKENQVATAKPSIFFLCQKGVEDGEKKLYVCINTVKASLTKTKTNENQVNSIRSNGVLRLADQVYQVTNRPIYRPRSIIVETTSPERFSGTTRQVDQRLSARRKFKRERRRRRRRKDIVIMIISATSHQTRNV